MIPSLARLFRWHVLRYLGRHPLLALLNVASVALGVAVYLAIQIANGSALHAFNATIDVVAGKADLLLTRPASGLSDEIFPAVARAPGISAATPLVRGFITLPDFPGEYLQVLGVDIFTNTPFRTFELHDFQAGEFDVQHWLGRSNAIAITEEFARRHDLHFGDRLRVQVNSADRELHVGFVLRASDPTTLDSHFASMDIGWAQEFFTRRGSLSAIELRLTNPEERESVMANLRAIVPADATVTTPTQRSAQVGNLLRGFQLNLTAMSLVSLLVGMFLIYNTVSASVVRRRREIGILRSLGTTRGEVRFLFLGEALTLGIVGVLLGLGGGILLARGLVGTVSKTISSLYILLSVRELAVAPAMFLSAAVAGLFSVLIAAWLPARAAARIDPVSALRAGTIIEQSARLSHAWAWSGVLVIFLAIFFSFVALSLGPPWIAFGAAFCVLVGFSLLVPGITFRFSEIASHLLRGAVSRLAAQNLSRSLARNAVTIAALAAAVAMAIGVSVMVFSFRRTVATWIDQTLLADIFIAPASNEIVGPSSFISPEVIRWFEARADIAEVDTFREVDLPSGAKSVAVAVIRGAQGRNFEFLHGDRETIMRRFRDEPCVIVSESFVRKNRVHDGDTLQVTTPDGPRDFPIAGTFYDYTRDDGVVYMNAKTFVAIWKDDRINSIALYLQPRVSSDNLLTQFRAEFSRAGQFLILSNRDLRQRVFEIFDQTFAVTYVLRTIAVIVAIVGICLTLTTLIAERTRELAIFRTLGGSVWQLRRLLLYECGMIGVLAAVVGLASGLCLSFVLTGVINRAFFGWTIQLAFPWPSLALTPWWIVAVAILAGLWPAWRAGRLVLAESLREE